MLALKGWVAAIIFLSLSAFGRRSKIADSKLPELAPLMKFHPAIRKASPMLSRNEIAWTSGITQKRFG
jgi:hypothetical protein